MNRLKNGIIVLAVFALVTSGWAKQEKAASELRLSLDLVDGSHIIGVPSIKSVPVRTPYAKMDIALKQIANIKIDGDNETASFELQNGDTISGILGITHLQLDAVFGPLVCPVHALTGLRVCLPDGLQPPDPRCWPDRKEYL
jgi:hypothetical protein